MINKYWMNVWILHSIFYVVIIICCCLFSRPCLALCYPVDWSTPVSSIHHCLLKFAKAHVHWVSDAIQPSHLPLPTSPTAFCLSQHQGLFQWIGSSHHAAKFFGASASASVLPMNIQGWFPLRLTYLISLLSKRLSRVFSNTTVTASILQHSAFFMIQLSHLYMTTGKTIALTLVYY